MCKISIELELDEKTLQGVALFLEHTQGSTESTHGGALDLPRLVAMLLEDVGMMASRPGCWEADHMSTVMRGHGY